MSKQHGRENDTVAVEATQEKSDVALREEAILAFWREHDIFNKSLTSPAGSEPIGDYVFYDGPPFATGTPHYGHLLAGTIKDSIPRFWTMQGYHVARKWGWDCHGLPLENLIEKKLGLANKRDIEEYGIKNFNEAARGAVMEYADYWKQVVPRMGRFADMEDDYKTMDSTYTESVWWVFSELHKKGLVSEGYKTMHLCPRCGTTLSNFEVNLGYKDIKDIAVTVKLPLLDAEGEVTDTSLLVWTTTPWTLPGNLAAAVNNEFEYVKVRISEKVVADNLENGKGEITTHNNIQSEHVIIAKERLSQLNFDANIHEVVETMQGSDLVGKSYQPPFPYLASQDFDQTNAWKIWHADYVELGEEGTGAVHLAPAYGEDDMVLAQANNIPIVHHVGYDGRFLPFVTDFAGQLVKPKDDDASGVTHLDADIEIVKALKANGSLFKKENITHSYPHCWRDDTPLLNYATTSWFVNVPKIKDELVAANNKVHWVPEHVGTNRFGKWLEGARDWAISRQRYWGAPLPIWRHPQSGEYKVIGSLADLQNYVPKSGNSYIVMRHGEAESNIEGIISAKRDNKDPLTKEGEEQVLQAAESLKDKQIDIIIHSGFLRTKQTAELVAKTIGVSAEQVLEDERIIELQPGDSFEGKTWSEYNAQFPSWTDRFRVTPKEGENRRDVQVRTGAFLHDLEAKYQGKRILVVAHAGVLFALESAAKGWTPEDAKQFHDESNNSSTTIYFKNAEIRELDFVPYPHNDNYELDYHRPYIDEVTLVDIDGTKLERVPDVFDCWFESGSMPYGQHHYRGENPEEFVGKHFPARFIAESVDQTRGWFYSLMVLGTALFGKSPFENVITNGLVLAEDGKKMSKSLQNYPDPMELVARQGADAMRLYLMTSAIIRGEDLNFSEKEVAELQRKNIGRLHNVLAMYEMYADGTPASADSPHVLDRWIITRLNQVIADTTAGYKNYELDKATRPLADFIDDVSVWYLRRSRERLKQDSLREASALLRGTAVDSAVSLNTSSSPASPRLAADTLAANPQGNMTDKALALGTLRYVLREFAKVMAPAMPFYAEYLYRAVRSEDEGESVHLAKWPESGEIDSAQLDMMNKTRMTVTIALEARTRAGVKVRQPLQSLTIHGDPSVLTEEHIELIKDELNVKDVTFDKNIGDDVKLDTTLTPELLAEGAARELIRAIQDLRKEQGLVPSDRIALMISTDERGQVAVTNHQDTIQKTVGATTVTLVDTLGTEVVSGEYRFVVAIEVLV